MCREMQGDVLAQWVQFGLVHLAAMGGVTPVGRLCRGLTVTDIASSAVQTHMRVWGGMVYVPPPPLARP